MRLNPDCIRAILLEVEDITDINNIFFYSTSSHKNFERLSEYTPDEILYHIRQCTISNLLYNTKWVENTSLYVQDLSPEGHEFLANIRNDTIWKKVKAISDKVGSEALPALIQIAANYIAQCINNSI